MSKCTIFHTLHIRFSNSILQDGDRSRPNEPTFRLWKTLEDEGAKRGPVFLMLLVPDLS